MNSIFNSIIKPLNFENGIGTIDDIKVLLDSNDNSGIRVFMKEAFKVEFPMVIPVKIDGEPDLTVELDIYYNKKILLLGDTPETCIPIIMDVPAFLGLSVTSDKTNNEKQHVTTYELNENALLYGYIISDGIERIIADFMSTDHVNMEQFNYLEDTILSLIEHLDVERMLEF